MFVNNVRLQIDSIWEKVMPDRRTADGWKGIVCALILTASNGVAAAQNMAPPPAVSVTPVVSRQVTETGTYVGRVTAIDKVDVVARVPGFIEERTFTAVSYTHLTLPTIYSV